MKPPSKKPLIDGIDRRDALLFTALASALALAGCGGGSDGTVAGVTSGGTGSFATGAITGFGSIIVGAIRFDDSKAISVLDVDDDNTDLRGQLKLGMVVRVKGKPKVGSSADAETIEVRSELLGPVSRIDANTLKVLEQTVKVTATTFFDNGLAGLASLALNDIVEVHGFVDSVNNVITATRIERKTPASVKAFKLQGHIRALTATTFQIGDLVISFASLIPSSLILTNGLMVRVRLEATLNAGARKARKIRAVELELQDRDEAEVEGTITAFTSSSQFSVNGLAVRLRLEATLNAGTRKAVKIRAVELEVQDRDEAKVEGTITGFTSSSQFSVNGLAVDASAAEAPAGLKPGDRVEVEGRLVKGVLIAKKVELEVENDLLKFELHGTVGSLNTTARTFAVRGVTVDFSAAQFSNGTATNLVDNVRVEVKGVVSADGTQLRATRIAFE